MQDPALCDVVTQITENLFLSSVRCAMDVSLLEKHKIGAIVSLLSMRTHSSNFPERSFGGRPFSWIDGGEGKMLCLSIRIDDDETERIANHFPSTFKFIKKRHKENKNVLVHCAQGISRSASIVIAFLIRIYNLDFVTTLRAVQRSRWFVLPNPGFQIQLKNFAEKCKEHMHLITPAKRLRNAQICIVRNSLNDIIKISKKINFIQIIIDFLMVEFELGLSDHRCRFVDVIIPQGLCKIDFVLTVVRMK